MGKTWPALEIYVPGCDPTLQELVLAELDDFEPSAIQELDESVRLRAFFLTSAARQQAAERIAASFGIHVTVESLEVPDDDWAARSQSSLRSITVGRIAVSPPWDVPPAQPDLVSVVIEPSMGFGTGHHATTRLMLHALQSIDVEGRSVLDVGTGSGVLAIAAAALGATSVMGTDVDPDALANARDNAALNGISDAVRFGLCDLEQMHVTADVVLANLTGGLILRTAPALAGFVAPGGRLIVSGFMESEPDVVPALQAWLTLQASSEEDEWRCAVFSR